MAKYLGRREAVGLGVEATRGTGVAATYLIGRTSYDFEDKALKARSGEALGVLSGEGSQAIVAQQRSEGSIEFEVGAKSLPAILKATFGAVSSAVLGTGDKHTITILESNQHPTLSIHLDNPNQDRIFERSMVDTFELNVALEEIVKATVGLKGQVSRDSTFDKSGVIDTEYKFVGRDLKFKVAANVAGLAAATALCLKEFSMTVNKNTDYDSCLGTLEPEDILNKQMTIEGSITLNYEDNVWRDYMLNGDYKACSVQLVQTRDAAGDQNPTVYFEFPRVDFSEWEASRDNDEIATQVINFMALYDIDNDRLISDCYVINDQDGTNY